MASVLKEIGARNTGLVSAYREAVRRLAPGPVSKLAASIVEQRHDLGNAIAEIANDRTIPEVEVEFDSEPIFAIAVTTISDPVGLLKEMAHEEAADHEILATVAGALLPASIDAAERLAAQADSARKRSTWAQDHIDLLSMG